MKKINIYPIKSIMSHDELISNDSLNLINQLKQIDNDLEFNYIYELNEKTINDNALLLVLVQSGGSENYFKEHIFKYFNGPYYLLTYSSSNSLAASLEILSFIKDQNRSGEILHGNNDYIVKRLNELSKLKNKKEVNLGVIGKPSDWLIASNVDYKIVKQKFNINLIDINQNELIELIKKDVENYQSDFNYDKHELNKALIVKEAIKKLINKYHLSGFTIRCFDLIKEVEATACISLSILNDEGVIAICEGDIPSLISAYLIKDYLNVLSFQANPQEIDPINNIVSFAHCTIPLSMCISYQLMTHFESNSSVAIKGEMEEKEVTVVKINALMNEFYLSSGTIINNGNRMDRCRTQIDVKLDSDVSYFLTSPLANHHLIIYGDHEVELNNYFKSFGLRRVI